MQVRVDDDMRVILTLTSEEYAMLGGDKDAVANAVEREFDGIFAVFMGGGSPEPAVTGESAGVVAAPVESVVVAPGGEFAVPIVEAPVTPPEVMTE